MLGRLRANPVQWGIHSVTKLFFLVFLWPLEVLVYSLGARVCVRQQVSLLVSQLQTVYFLLDEQLTKGKKIMSGRKCSELVDCSSLTPHWPAAPVAWFSPPRAPLSPPAGLSWKWQKKNTDEQSVLAFLIAIWLILIWNVWTRRSITWLTAIVYNTTALLTIFLLLCIQSELCLKVGLHGFYRHLLIKSYL